MILIMNNNKKDFILFFQTRHYSKSEMTLTFISFPLGFSSNDDDDAGKHTKL